LAACTSDRHVNSPSGHIDAAAWRGLSTSRMSTSRNGSKRNRRQPAEQGARANAGICHAACFLTSNAIEATECGSSCCTRRARSRRGCL
jgi:hypothetical protein